jgi:hypothetical protein
MKLEDFKNFFQRKLLFLIKAFEVYFDTLIIYRKKYILLLISRFLKISGMTNHVIKQK